MRNQARIRGLACLSLATAALGCVRAAAPLVLPREPRGWTQIRGSQFLLTTDLGPAGARHFAEDLEMFTALLRRVTPQRGFPESPLQILVFANASDFERHRLEANQGGFFVSDGKRSFALMNEAAFSVHTRQKLFHEFTHYLMSATAQTGSYPLWYHEGLAEMLSSAEWKGGSATIGLPPARIAGERASGRWIPLVDLLAVKAVSELPNGDRSLFYAESWALVHQLHTVWRSTRPERFRQMHRYLKLMRRGVGWRKAAKRAFGASFALLESELRQHWIDSERRVGGIAIDVALLELAESGPPRSLPQREVDASLAELEDLVRRVRGARPEAPPH